MDWLLLRPASIPALTQLTLAIIILLSLLWIKDKSYATRLLAAFFFFNTILFSTIVLTVSVGAHWAFYFALSQHVVLFFSLTFLIQFAYEFLGNPFQKESRIVFLITSMLSVSVLLYMASQAMKDGPYHHMPLPVIGLLFPSMICWALSVHFRKTRYFSKRDKLKGKAHKEFMLLNGLIAFIALAASLRDAELLSVQILQYILVICILAYLAGFVAIYVSYTSYPISLQIRLVGISLVTVLAILGLAGVGIYNTPQLYAESGISSPANETIRFTQGPEQEYDITKVPFFFDSDLGENLDLSDEESKEIELGFMFPFYDQDWTNLYVSDNGLISMGKPIRLPDRILHRKASVYYQDFYGPSPKIAPLFLDLDPQQEGGVYLKENQNKATITWHNVPQWGTSNRNTFQMVLRRDGSFDFSYETVEATLVNDATGGLRGFHAGLASNGKNPLSFSAFDSYISQPFSSVYEDYRLQFRQYAHTRVVRLTYLILWSTLFILIAFPLFLKASITKPIEELLSGVVRVNEGDLNVRVPVRMSDEIGRLAKNFNQMTESIHTAKAKLKAHSEELEQRVEERTLELESANKELAHANKELQKVDQIKSRFFANISHEFRTPLTLINGPLERLISEDDADEIMVSRSRLGSMLQGSQLLLRLTNQILDLAKIDAGKMHIKVHEGDIVDYVKALVNSFTSYAKSKGVDLTFQDTEKEILLFYDVSILEKALYNLLSNAIKFTPKGVVRVKVLDKSPEQEMIEIVIKDSGIGIPSNRLDRIFERFYQVDHTIQSAYTGTGIGLHLTRELIELHKGRIEVDSEEGIGSTFTIALPKGGHHFSENERRDEGESEYADRPPLPSLLVAKDQGYQRGPSNIAQVKDKTNEYTLLIVDDNPHILAHLKERLSPSYDVQEAQDGQEALNITYDVIPDVIIADVMMPVMDGFTLCQKIKEDRILNHIPVILLTASASDDSRLEGLGAGANVYLSKPFNDDELLTHIKNLLDLRASMQDQLRKEFLLQPLEPQVLSADEELLKHMQEIIEEHMADAMFNVDAMAEQLHMSTRQLQRKVKALIGETPSLLIRRSRLERAGQLLRQQAGTISEIAYRVGFNDAAYFTRCFKDRFGTSPTHFLKDS